MLKRVVVVVVDVVMVIIWMVVGRVAERELFEVNC